MGYTEFIYRSFWGLPIDLKKDLRQDTKYLSPQEVHHEKEEKKKD